MFHKIHIKGNNQSAKFFPRLFTVIVRILENNEFTFLYFYTNLVLILYVSHVPILYIIQQLLLLFRATRTNA